MVDFAAGIMRVQYRSILEEHKAVRAPPVSCDVSHMGEVDVRGSEAARFLNQPRHERRSPGCFPAACSTRRCAYPTGGVVDDLLVYIARAGGFFLCIQTPANIDKDLAW